MIPNSCRSIPPDNDKKGPKHRYVSDRLVFPTRLAGNEEGEDDGQWKLYFKLYCFLDVESMPKEGVEFAFMFEQVCFSPRVTLLHHVAVGAQ